MAPIVGDDGPMPEHAALETERSSSTLRPLGLAFGVGIALDLAVNGQRPGAALALFVAVVALATRTLVPRTAERDPLLALAAIFGAFVALRASTALVALDLTVVTVLIGLAASRGDEPILRTRVEGFMRKGVHLAASAARAPAALLVPVAALAGRTSRPRVRAAARAGLVALPILSVFAVLLASADRVFGSVVFPGLPDVDLAGAAAHAGLIAGGALIVATLWRAASRPLPPPFPAADQPLLPRVGFGEWITVLAGLDLLFAIFVGVQIAFLFGGERSVEVTPGLTYAAYARSGFFQLIVVAGLTSAVILGGWDLGRRERAAHERLFRWLVTAMVGLTGVILASALMRLALYEQEFGFTMNRLAGYLAIGWIAFVLLVLLGAIWRGARDQVVALALTGGLIALLALNLMDAERFVAQRNVARFDARGKIDASYLGYGLGADAIPVAVSVLPRLPREEAAVLAGALCERTIELEGPQGWRSANRARAAARDVLRSAGFDAARCAADPGSIIERFV